jgi:hypothetical protein
MQDFCGRHLEDRRQWRDQLHGSRRLRRRTITKSITIDCDGTFGSILAAATNGVNINGANIIVNLRNLSINGVSTGLIGVNFISGAMLSLHNVNITGFRSGTAAGIRFSPNSANSVLLVTNSSFTSNGIVPATGAGIAIQPAVGGSAFALIENSRIEFNSNGVAVNSTSGQVAMTVRDTTVTNHNGSGIIAAGGNNINAMLDRLTVSNSLGTGILSSSATSTIRINNSVITGNATGVGTAAGGVLRSYKNNAINGNVNDGTPIPQENLN